MAGEEGERNYVFRILTRQGDVRWLQINSVPIAWGGRPATLNFLADFTEREQLQQDLQRTLGELRRALEQERELSS
jgi:PAS domain S-box-containing protein